MLAAGVLAGCGDGDAKKPSPATPDRRPVDVRIVVNRDGSTETAFIDPADPKRQRVTLVNRTRFHGVVSGRSRSGGASVGVGPGERGAATWPRSKGPDKLRVAARFPGHSVRNTASTTPIG